MAMSTGYIIGFAASVCVVCSLGVAGASMGLRGLQQANETKAFQEKVLAAVDLPPKDDDGNRPRLSVEETDKLFDEKLELVLVDQSGAEVMAGATDAEKVARVEEARAAVKGTGTPPEVVPLYKRIGEDGDVKAYALEMRGKGLWGPISGYLALEPDGKTVKNVAFDAPKETPGLGAEIMQKPFKEQWIGKKVVTRGGELKPIAVVKGSAELKCKGDDLAYCVDGVSGATITGRGVDDMVDEAVTRDYASYLKKIQKTGA